MPIKTVYYVYHPELARKTVNLEVVILGERNKENIKVVEAYLLLPSKMHYRAIGNFKYEFKEVGNSPDAYYRMDKSCGIESIKNQICILNFEIPAVTKKVILKSGRLEKTIDIEKIGLDKSIRFDIVN
ncbi:hypothetical protein HGB47_16420 [Leptospira yasudae]|uniref:hypothetical protein n=1 Tax=Leptospira yasudae TaxID=2202201 RepID=UPI001C4FAA22|nr:hypothetical protein [Leptospira yasudae]MBW0435198.1 hypothetical protein [Leptospira yasudae]